MNNFYTITSNSLDSLAARLAGDIKQSSATPSLSPETVIVQSIGMSRWISIEMSRLNGICAGINYKFPNTFIDEIFNNIMPEPVSISPFDPQILCWHIMGVLPELLNQPEFEPVKSYCNGCIDDRGLLQFSIKVADCFDQYTIYRPEMILEWDRGGGSGWQPILWRKISGHFKGQHRAALLNSFREKISGSQFFEKKLPTKIRLFGVSYLPPFHLEILSLLSKFTEVIFYLLNPCGEYWGDIVSQKKLASLSLNYSLTSEAQEYYETGNPLLSSLGTMGQEFFNMLLDCGAICTNVDDPVKKSFTGSLLNLVQSDILHMQDRSRIGSLSAEIDLNDRSVQVHSCHGPLREMQVLYDNLLQMFTEMPDLEPRQIIVMTPDIESYAPYISAIFGTHYDDRPEIPFSIADRSQRNENPEIATFIKIMKLPGSRFGINQILELLESDAILSRFSISSDELENIRIWLSATRVRWGIDKEHREKLGFPAYNENTWQAAIDRLLLGYALPPDGNRLFHDIYPFSGIEGSKALTLGKLIDFFKQIKSSSAQMTESRSLTEWADTLTSVVKNLMRLSDQTSNNLKPVFEALQKLRVAQELSGFNSGISLESLRLSLSSLFDNPGASFGFLGGKVTFCAMLPMRSIPFRVICMVGMNDSGFPRVSRQPGFSMMNGKRLCGDRSLREEDRYLFLEALMSAEERIFISYTGQNCRDNSDIPPSVVVSELLDYINTGFTTTGKNGRTKPETVVKHHLQSFSQSYFSSDSTSPLFSYSRADCLALEARRIRRYIETPFCNRPLPEPEKDVYNVDILSLIRFFANPAKQFLVRRLGVRPDRLEAMVEERESFNLDSLDNYSLKQELVRLYIEGGDKQDVLNTARAESRLPPLAAGLFAFESAASETESFANKVLPHLTELLDPLTVSLEIGKFYVSGQLSGIHSGQHLRFRCANLKGKDRLGLWIEHLVLNAYAASGYPDASLLVCRDASISLPPISNATEILQVMLDIYHEGLCRPLHFFPESSLKMQLKGLSEAEKCWNGGEFGGMVAERDDPSYNLCFGRENPLNEEFIRLAQVIYGPLLAVSNDDPA